MSDPNSHKERPTSSKLEVRIPQATNSDEQKQEIEKTDPPHSNVQEPISHNDNTAKSSTDLSENQPEQGSQAVDSPPGTEPETEKVSRLNTTSQNAELNNDENENETQQNARNEATAMENAGIETVQENEISNTSLASNNEEVNSKSERAIVEDNSNDKIANEPSQESKVTDNLQDSSHQQASTNDQTENDTVETSNQANTVDSKPATLSSSEYPATAESEIQQNKTPNSNFSESGEADAEKGATEPTQKEATFTEPTSSKVTDSETRQSESTAPTNTNPPKPDTSDNAISIPNNRQNSQPTIGKNTDKPDDTQPAESAESNNPPQTNGNNEKGQARDQSRAQSTSSQTETRRSSAASSRNLEAMQNALDTRKESGTGFVLSSEVVDKDIDSKADNTTEQILPQRDPPDGDHEHQQSPRKHPQLSTSTAKFSPRTSKSKDSTYMTEAPDNQQPNTRESSSHTYSPAYIDTAARQPPEGGIQNMGRKKKKTKKDKERERILARLNLPKPPPQYELKLQPLKPDPDPNNAAPLNPNIYYTNVPKAGGVVKTPFYVQVDIPKGALDGEVRLKFERQEFDRMKLGLTDDDTLCSCIIDLNMEPLSYCLRQNATIRMRILEKCVNQFEETVIITSRHFSWMRTPTRVETKTVNGEKHYYAVAESQAFGKFAVINTQKMDRFIITKGGGDFHSTISQGIKISVEEDQFSSYPPQMVEMIIRDIKEDAVQRTSKEIPCVTGSNGKLVGASPLIEISKNVMAQSGKMKHGVRFPDAVSLYVPVPKPTLTYSDTTARRKVVMLRQHTNPQYNTINGYRFLPNAYSKNAGHTWKDITNANRMAADGVTFQDDESMRLQITAPGKYLILAFEDDDSGETETEMDLDDMSNAITEMNREHKINIMIHQKTTQPSIIMMHVVTGDAVEPISKAMASTKTWNRIYQSEELVMHEWQPIKLEFKGDLKPTVNQMTPEIRFYSKRWQGYQFQLEATDEAFATSAENLIGEIIFIEEECQSVRKSRSNENLDEGNERRCICEAKIEIQRTMAKPFKPTVVVKEVPKVPIYREYKMNWLKHLSPEDIERYKAAHGV